MGKISVSNIRVYAYHGCLKEESINGSDYRVDVEVEADLAKASLSDHLKDTVDYVLINYIVKEEMAIKSKLLEHVAKRILDRIFKECSTVDSGNVTVSKINPPINGDVEMVSINLQLSR
ncbi:MULTISPECIES: dihydroneopterin aldolase [Cellulophaga]|uniref:dihydroneopterin aldolase n=1 Tax=Cellulophaga TaxID=104264 RepID=UPI000409C89B|nr:MULTISPECIES: dihydroneopterin aldolase [Cellulophaga]AIY12636.1 dihydroneopterin aldolase [Cellulophaga baltica NN016038]KGK30499.1 dihydroneopterin aldolase [Cellulophaga sp. E6(2014)]MCR1023176.1 dihydroneopterin aldolase [Cellulophaga baltica]QXP51093.1 dihydroneopterin aldolase [Cellulophaga sp. HaHa_2_1]QXP56579.1 dihydroneopterin aldolase [Cellulophaga sp. HaHa_2_95]